MKDGWKSVRKKDPKKKRIKNWKYKLKIRNWWIREVEVGKKHGPVEKNNKRSTDQKKETR